MKRLDENVLEENGLKMEFIGWTNSGNTDYPDINEEIKKNQTERQTAMYPKFVPNPGKEEYVTTLKRANRLAPLLVTQRIFVKGIEFAGKYHVKGDYGALLFKVNDLGIFRWSTLDRYWDNLIYEAGYGFEYGEWYGQPDPPPVTPDMAEEKKFLVDKK